MGFCAGITILGGLITVIGGFMLKKHLATLKENAQLKDLAVRNAISDSRSALEKDFAALREKFEALKQRVEEALLQQKGAVDGLANKHERTMGVMKKAYEQSDSRFKAIEARMEKTHFLVDRLIKRGTGA